MTRDLTLKIPVDIYDFLRATAAEESMTIQCFCENWILAASMCFKDQAWRTDWRTNIKAALEASLQRRKAKYVGVTTP